MFGFKLKRTKKPKVRAPETEVPLDQAPAKLKFEIVREKDDDLVVIKKGKVKKAQEIYHWQRGKPLKRSYFINHIVKREVGGKALGLIKARPEYLVRWNSYWSEALDAHHAPIPEYSKELNNLLLADMGIQLKNGIARGTNALFNEEMIRVLLAVFLLSIPFGIFLDTMLGWIPSSVVHWVP